MEENIFQDETSSQINFQNYPGKNYKVKINTLALKHILISDTQSVFSEPEEVRFNLLPEIDISFRTEVKKCFLDSGFIWEGSAPGQPDLRANLSVIGLDDGQDLFVAGAFYHAGKRFVITPSEAGYVSVHLFERQKELIPLPSVKPQSTAPEPEFFDLASDESVAVINALALYPVKMLTSPGENSLKAIIGHMQQTATQVFKNSGINAIINFIAYEAVPELENPEVDKLLSDVGSVDVGGTGKVTHGKCWNSVSALRDAHDADIVVLLGEGKAQGLAIIEGIAMSIPEPVRFDQSDLSVATLAVAVSNTHSADPGITFSHEVGHLLGGKHSRNVQPTRSGLSAMYDYAHAYISPDKSYVTMMGYDVDAKEVLPAYSSADSKYNGKPLGVAIDKPGAADVASLFRLTTRVMASYRGTNVSDKTQILKVEVDPIIGGTVLPAELGPYSKGTVVNVKAMPRAGHTFKHWLLDGVVAGTKNIMSVKMDTLHTLKAVFVNGQDHWITVHKDSSITYSGGTVTFKPEGHKFPYGTEITISFLSGKYTRSHATYWVVDGINTGLTVNEPLTLLPEQDLKIGVQLGTIMPQDVKNVPSSSIFPGGKHCISLVFYDMWGPLSNRKYTLSVLGDYNGVKGYTGIKFQESIILTDSYGVAILQYDANPALTETAFLSFKDEKETSLIFKMSLINEEENLRSNTFRIPIRNQYILAGNQPSPVEFTLVDTTGKPAVQGKNCEFTFSTDNYAGDKTGIKLTSSVVKTDACSKGVLSFSASEKQGAGTKVIRYKDIQPSVPFALIHVLPSKIEDFLIAPKALSLKAGEHIGFQVVTVNEAYQLLHLSELGMAFSELNLKIDMDDGGTGLQCQQKSTALTLLSLQSGKTQGFPLFMSKSSARGTARMHLYLENKGQRLYTSPIEIVFNVS